MKLSKLLFTLFLPIYCFGQSTPEECAITEFSINGIYGTISQVNDGSFIIEDEEDEEFDDDYYVISLSMPDNTDRRNLTPDIKVTPGSKVYPASGQTIDFTKRSQTIYTVTDEKGNKKTYRVEVDRRKKEYLDFLSFTFNLSGRVIAPYKKTHYYGSPHIYINLPQDTDLRSLKPTIVTNTGITISPDPDTPQDFSQPVKYTLTTEDGNKNWVWIHATNFKPQIHKISADTLYAGEIINIQGKFAKENELILTYEKHEVGGLGGFDDWPKLEIISTDESELKVRIPTNVVEGIHGIKVYNDQLFDKVGNIMIVNPLKPVIESTDKTTMRVGIDSLTIKGKNLHGIDHIVFASQESGNWISYDCAMINDEGTELVLKKTPAGFSVSYFQESETYYFRANNQHTYALEEVPIIFRMEKEDLYKYNPSFITPHIVFPDDDDDDDDITATYLPAKKESVTKSIENDVPFWGYNDKRNQLTPDENKIKTVTRVEYEYISGEPDWESGFISEVQEYDKKGNIIKITSIHQSEYLKEFDEIEMYYNNDSGKTDSVLIYTLDNQLTTKRTFHYDDNIKTIYSYLSTGALDLKIVHKYDENDDLICRKVYSADGVLKREYIKTYDDIGLKKASTLKEGVVIEETIRINNDKQVLTFETRDEDGFLSEIETNTYDKDDNLIESHTIFKHKYSDDSVFHWKYSYFENGLSKEDILFNEKGEPKELKLYYYELWD